MGFLKTPYLPQGRVIVAVGDVENAAAEVVKPFCLATLPPSMQHHADLSFCYLGEGVAVCAPEAYAYYNEKLACWNVKLIKGEKSVGSNYPCDAAYNVAIVGKRLFCKVDITDRVLLNEAKKLGYKIININQGYAKCSVCPVDENSAISADMSFYKAAVKEGIDVLRITNEGIILKGFANGFFGGAAYCSKRGVLKANGDMTTLPEYTKIKEFLNKRGMKIEEDVGAVTDFGSFIPLCEE